MNIPEYNFMLLENGVFANGINNLGQVVGLAHGENDAMVGSWWIPSPIPWEFQYPGGGIPSSFPYGLTAINNLGIVLNPGSGPELICIDFDLGGGGGVFQTPPAGIAANATAINNTGQLVSGDQIFTWANGGIAPPAPLPTTFGPAAGYGINDLGDVVGSVGGTAFFYPGQPSHGPTIYLAGQGQLSDINKSKVAVGFMDDDDSVLPSYVQCQSSNLQMKPIDLPYALPANVSSAKATAVNSGGTIVGYAPQPLPQKSHYAFVARIGEQAQDLNTLMDTQGWNLAFAMDVNDSGQIVGWATQEDSSGVTIYAAFAATPIHYGILPGLLFGSGFWDLVGTLMGNNRSGSTMLPLPGTGLWASLPPQQRQTLLSFAISNLAGRLNDSEARSKIQSIAADAASRALDQNKRPQRQTPTPAQSEQIARALDHLLGR